MNPEQQYKSLVESLRLVAAPKEQQVSALPDFVVVTDEVAMTFGDAFLLAPQLVRGGLVTDEAFQALARLDEWLERMPTDGSISSLHSLENHPFWRRSRELATNALFQLKESLGPPDLSHIFWTQ